MNSTLIFYLLPVQNQLFGKGKDRIFHAGARIKRALSPGRNPDWYDISPQSSPKVPRLSFDPEISDDEDDNDDKEKDSVSAAN